MNSVTEAEVLEQNPEEPEEETPRSRLSFYERAESMGLTIEDYGRYTYQDSLSDLIYKQLITLRDQEEIPFLALYCSEADDPVYHFIGNVSDSYQFVGHDAVNNAIRNSITSVGTPVLEEVPMTMKFGSQMMNEIVIRHRNNIAEVGDVYPQLRVTNGYAGTRAVNITFGITIHDGQRRLGAGFKKFGAMRQIHIRNARTTIGETIGTYVERFNQGIGPFIQQNFDETLEEDTILTTLELVEKLGIKRRNNVSALLNELVGSTDPALRVISRWQLFIAITRFSSIEKNLNTKLMMESIAERCLNFPVQMSNVLSQVNSR